MSTNENLEQAMHYADTVTVEFGTGSTPLFDRATGSERFDAAHLYVGVNIDPLQHKLLAERLSQTYAPIDSGHAVLQEVKHGNMNALPINSQCVSTVFMGNVLGEPDDACIMEKFMDKHGVYQGHSSTISKQATIQEAARILKPDGELIIFENDTPYTNLAIGKKYAGAIALLETTDLQVASAVHKRDSAWKAAVQPYDGVAEWWSPDSYIVTATKV